MTPERWREVQRLFHAALELPPERRAGFLAEGCAGDAELCAEVEALVAEDQEAGGFFDGLAADAFDAFAGEEHGESGTAPLEGRRVGPYTIVRQIGRGGMGVVYLARREDVGLSAALKLVAGGLAAPERTERFLFERRVLARLEHPHIARLLDAGVTEDGTPWFAMEYVPGEPIDRFCDTRRLSVPERIALFERVCDAVAYAHRNLVVHRDLKPGNVFVTGDGTPKLLDFGIAKPLEEREEGRTGTGMRLLTPEYAAPEQLTGEPVTTATDIYQLGLVLYELLCGHRPYRFAGRTPSEIERMVRSGDPPRPSVAVTRPEERRHTDGHTETISPEQVAAARSIEPGHLKRRLSGDLDAIVMHALAKEPERRYPSAEALLDDLRRHRQGLPVRARPDSRSYRARKFIRRNRLPVAAAALLVLLLAGFAGAMTVQQARTARERDRAQLEADKAEQVATLLADLFTASDPYRRSGATLTAEELLGRGVERIDDLEKQPDVQARMLGVIGRVYLRMGLYPQARPLLERSLRQHRRLHGEQHFEVARSLNDLGELYQLTGEPDRADSLHSRALQMRRALFPAPHPDIAQSLANLGNVRFQRGKPQTAEQFYREALGMYRATLPDRDERLPRLLVNTALALKGQGKFTEADSLYVEAITTFRELPGPQTLNLAQTLHNRAALLTAQDRYADAEAALREVLALKRSVSPEGSPSVATTLGDLGSALFQQGRYGEAERVQQEALDMRLARLGPDHPHVGVSRMELAHVHSARREYAQAERGYRQALAIFQRRFGPDHGRNAQVMLGLGEMYLARGEAERAVEVAREGVRIRVAARGERHAATADAKRQLGESLVALGRFGEAEPLLLQAHEVFHSARGADAPDTREVRGALASLYQSWGKPEQASRYRTRGTMADRLVRQPRP